MKRVGIFALLHESNTFVEEPTTIRHFEENLLAEGPDVIAAFRNGQHEVSGFIEALDGQTDIECPGGFAARAMPFGTISAECWHELTDRLANAVRRYGPFDGILVAPHGATVASSAPDADGDWLTRLRNLVGPDVPVIGTLDLHANVSQAMVDACDALIGYRTNPHLDQRQCGFEAGQILLRKLRGEIDPRMALVALPMCMNIERQATAEPHGQRLWQESRRIEQQTPGLLSLSCLYGFPYSDVIEMGTSIIAVADADWTIARDAASQLADYLWDSREEFRGELISVDDAIARAAARQGVPQPVGFLDMGDNVGGGSPGDGTWILHAWRATQSRPILGILYDPRCVQTAEQAGVGGRFMASIGGKLAPAEHGPPIEVAVEVQALSDGRFSEQGITHGGYSQFDQGPTAVLRDAHGHTFIVTSRRVAPLSLQQILSQGVSPSDFAAIVIKGVHAPVAVYRDVCSELIRVNTPGATTADLDRLSFKNRRRPLFPWERVDAR